MISSLEKNSDLRIYPTYKIRLKQKNYRICTKWTGNVHICPTCKIFDLGEFDLGEFHYIILIEKLYPHSKYKSLIE